MHQPKTAILRLHVLLSGQMPQSSMSASGVSLANVVLLPMGVGSGKEKTMEFTFFPAAAGVMSGFLPTPLSTVS